MDALRLLEQQHDEVKKLFTRIEKAEGDEAWRLFTQIRDRLTLHEELEETHLYPKLKQEDTTGELVLESYQEHHVIDVLLDELGNMKPADEAFQPKVKVLQENVEHHIQEEEKELFPKVRKLWDTDKRQQIGQQMEEMNRRESKVA